VTGFLEESDGVWSMSRLAIATLLFLAAAIVGVTCWYVVRGQPNAAVLGALATILAALVVNGSVAIIKRNGGSDAA
jgi:membrane protein YdbS with pleckstrin-like domain